MIQPWMQPDISLLSDEEIQKVIISIMEGKEEVDEAEISQAVDWAVNAKLGGILFDMVQSGNVAIAGMEGELNPLITVRQEVLSRVREAFYIVFGED